MRDMGFWHGGPDDPSPAGQLAYDRERARAAAERERQKIREVRSDTEEASE